MNARAECDASLALRDVSKSYGDHRVLESFSCDVFPGEIVALVGPNGAGKSTVMGIAAGVIPSDAGTVMLLGRDVTGLPHRAATNMAYAGQRCALYEMLTVRENLVYAMRLARFSKADAAAAISDCPLPLSDIADERVDHLSEGQRRRAHVALALLRRTSVLVLDEPTAGLDARHRQTLVNVLHSRAGEKGTAILISTHIADDVELLDARLRLVDPETFGRDTGQARRGVLITFVSADAADEARMHAPWQLYSSEYANAAFVWDATLSEVAASAWLERCHALVQSIGWTRGIAPRGAR